MQDFDLIGTDAVADFIRHAKMQFFYIHRYPSQNGTIPVYESLANVNANAAANDFIQWANIANRKNKNTIPYVITVVNSRDNEEATTEDLKRAKRNKVRASFVLNYSEAVNDVVSGVQQPINDYSQNNFNRADIDRMIKESTERAMLKIENERLQKELDEALDELDGYDEGQGEVNQNINQLLGLAMAQSKGKKEPAALSGITDEKKMRLNAAVKTLLRHDKDLDVHLAKLAQMAETQTAKFNVLLSMLDNQ